MPNLGEEICGDYLKYILNCQFVSYNIQTLNEQGEIDVIGINIKENVIYCCEVAIHTQGFGYVKDNKPDDYNRLYAKFSKDLRYLESNFPTYHKKMMFWSSIVKNSKITSKYNALDEVLRFQQNFFDAYGIKVELIINNEFKKSLQSLREHSKSKTKEFQSNVMRLFQIEETLTKHLKEK